ncbi:MAG TPA: zinc ABC transporter substrate-binding protein [Acidimicrobiales bacterium]|nr:zinc ABC transporter substrate-binding protein [Acidimicrobiales bacterium]
MGRARVRAARRAPVLRAAVPLVGALGVLAITALAVAVPSGRPPGLAPAGTVPVVAAENFWGSIVTQVGGDRVSVTSIITNPNADPHAYEPTPADARAIASARLVVVNGIGYDPWAAKLVAADAGTSTVLDVGSLLGLRAGANPHRWYDPADVRRVVAAVAADLGRLDPAGASYFRRGARRFLTVALAPYDALVREIRSRYAGTPVGASESIF